jgi:hypothetical protein
MFLRIFAALLVGAALAAQTSSISGTVRNAYNLIPIPGALVRLDDGEKPVETFTDATGHYRFSDIDQTTYNLRIEKVGYLFQPDYSLSNQAPSSWTNNPYRSTI